MFRALQTRRSDDAIGTHLVALDDGDLPPGDVVVDVGFSSINYKDGLAIAGRPGVIRSYPLIPGIDLVGSVRESASPRWSAGDPVVLTGHGLGETHDGGLAERTRVPGGWLLPLPAGLEPRRAAAIGTAGLTAMLAVLALERHGLRPGDGDVLVTGAAGGVGSIATALLSGLGHRVVASTGRAGEEGPRLRALGAAEVVDRIGGSAGRPLQSERWAAAVDSVGSTTLANVLAQTGRGGIAVACGLAQGPDLPATVLPFILRGVTLAGIDSVEASRESRLAAWARLTTDLDPGLLDGMTTSVSLAESIGVAERILAGRVAGRVVVDVRA
jgi:acrylyl-CoA reductase (NADPH)